MAGTHASIRGGATPTTRAPVPRSTSRTAATRTAKLTAPLRGQWATQAGSTELHGSRAAAWIAMWDKGSVVRRVSLLETLKSLHAESNSNALDDDLGDAAPLLFARVTSWWKLRYGTWAVEAARITAAAAAAAAAVDTSAASPSSPSPSPSTTSELLAQVEAITIFIRGSRYLLQFVEGGGAAALCDCLEVTSSIHPSSSSSSQLQSSPATNAVGGVVDAFTRERRAITLLLLHIANSGRVYREMVGDVTNLLHLLHALQREGDAAVAVPVTELLAVLGKGHPRLSGSVQTGLLRVLACALPPSDDDGNGEEEEEARGRAGSVATTATSEVVVLSVARAVRALQLQVEQQHYAQFPPTTGEAEAVLTATTRAMDFVPIVGLDAAVALNPFAGGGGGGGGGMSSLLPSPDPLLAPFSTIEYLAVLFHLALDEQHTAYRVEGNELLNLAAKNIHLTPKILTRCLDVVDDDVYTLESDETTEEAGVASQRLRRQRRQLSCGRAAVLILISRPMTSERRDLLLHLVAQRGGHLTLLKYLRLTQHGDSAAVVDCCHALQFVARASMEMQRRRLGQAQTSRGANAQSRATASEAVLVRMTEGIQSSLGDAVFQLLLFQELSEEDCMAILRSARAAVVGRAE